MARWSRRILTKNFFSRFVVGAGFGFRGAFARAVCAKVLSEKRITTKKVPDAAARAFRKKVFMVFPIELKDGRLSRAGVFNYLRKRALTAN
jgi:hypothetical protein